MPVSASLGRTPIAAVIVIAIDRKAATVIRANQRHYRTMNRTLSICLLSAAIVAGSALVAVPAVAQTGPPIRDPQHRFEKPVHTWLAQKRVNVVMQKQDYSCGAAAMATVARYYWGDPVGEHYFLSTIVGMLTHEQLEDRIKNGLTMTDMRLAAVKLGYVSTIGRLSYDELTQAKVPLVVGITVRGFDHFVVYRGSDDYYVYLADPIRGNLRIPAWEFVKQWQKNAVLVLAKPGQGPREHSPLTVTDAEKQVGAANLSFLRRNILPPPRLQNLERLSP